MTHQRQRPLRRTPIVYQGTMYVTTRRSTVALDATTCRPKWRYKWTPRASATTVRHVPGREYMGGTDDMERASRGWLTAIDASTGATVWKYESKRPLVAAVTATKGHVIFTGELTGDFLAFDARNGKELYRFNTGGAIGGGVITYKEGDKQYVAVMSGRPSSFWVDEIAGSPTVFLFALP